MPKPAQPLVYSCSGCSNVAHLAVRLDRAGLAETSCIAGIGGRFRCAADSASVNLAKHGSQ